MLDSNGSEIVEEVQDIKNQDISYNKHILWQLERISKIRCTVVDGDSVDKNIFALIQAINSLEDDVEPYMDADLRIELNAIDAKFPNAEETEIGEVQLLVKSKSIALQYAREKQRVLMKLLRRRNMLLQEDAPPGEIGKR